MSEGDGWYRLSLAVGRLALRSLKVTARVEGAEHLPVSGPVLLASTHGSYPDFLFVERGAITRGRHVRFMCRHDVWNNPLVARPMTRMRHIPVDRQAPAGAYLTARQRLLAGDAVCAFPEAGISYSYTVRALMPGVASLARATGVPVVPVALWGGQRIWSVGRLVNGKQPRPDLTRGRLVDIAFGAPMRIGPDDDLVEWTRSLGAAMTDLLEGLQKRPEHVPGPGEPAPWYPAHLGGQAPDRAEAALLDSVPASAIAPTWGPAG